ncbi:tail protein X [Azospirillum sp. TSH64]|uniref:tail protein X n=1 Tax=Azospirillum sp. TSH64 TaxID=652740 RepID=UPI000D6223BB|nr:tail protein X [Azospirillum sp. TSH64]PWC81242.1 phage tail protein [Azospirillum sp. TSH64]
MATYRTSDGDEVDWICWRHYGRTAGTVEAVLAANPDLADHGPKLPGGLLIELPELAEPERQRLIRLWD